MDHPAERAVWDLLRRRACSRTRSRRLMGSRPTPGSWASTLCSDETHEIGLRGERNEGFVVSIVALKAGERRSIGFIDDGAAGDRFTSTPRRFLASEHNRELKNAKSLIEMAVEQLLARAAREGCLVPGRWDCRRFWNGLTDTGGDALSGASGEIALQWRLRRDVESCQPWRYGDWPQDDDLGPAAGCTDALYRLKEKD